MKCGTAIRFKQMVLYALNYGFWNYTSFSCFNDKKMVLKTKGERSGCRNRSRKLQRSSYAAVDVQHMLHYFQMSSVRIGYFY
jgi:hypothetical protein